MEAGKQNLAVVDVDALMDVLQSEIEKIVDVKLKKLKEKLRDLVDDVDNANDAISELDDRLDIVEDVANEARSLAEEACERREA